MLQHASRRATLAVALVAAGLGTACGDRSSELLVVYSGDCQGYIEPCGCSSGRLGGLARRATALAPLYSTHSERLVVDAGGWAERKKPDQRALRSQVLLAALHDLGLEIANVSMRDLRLGAAGLAAIADSTGVQLVSANVHAPDAPWLRPYVVLARRVGGRNLRIGVTGVTTASDCGDEWPNGEPTFDDPIVAARNMLDVLVPQTDVQVLLATLPPTELDREIATLGGYDLLVAGTGDLREAPAKSAIPLVVAPGTMCKFVTWATLRPGAELAVAATGVVSLDARVADEPRMAARVTALKARLGDTAKEAAAAAGAKPVSHPAPAPESASGR
jgi:2',3'-cyclic-nucleotide 2'-phosphodiesterase (5'-nucleotidase family)